VTGLAKAQAQFTRELASASPAAARELGKRFDEVTDAAARQAGRVPGEAQVEGAVRGAAAREQDLPIANYDKLSVKEINSRLRRLSEVDRTTVEVYERKHKKPQDRPAADREPSQYPRLKASQGRHTKAAQKLLRLPSGSSAWSGFHAST